MQHYTSLHDVDLQDAWLAIGSFDGVHLGHQQILEQLTAGAHAMGNPAVVLTFYPHPRVVLNGPKESFYLSLPEEKAKLLGKLGVDVVITHPFNLEVAARRAASFLEELQSHLGFRQLWVGHDFALGRNREGDLPALKKFGETMNFQVREVTGFAMGGDLVSSSRIRRLLEAGEIQAARKLLGRAYTVQGTVVEGDKRGSSIGIPTANLDIPKEKAVPKEGVYACQVQWGDQTLPAVANIGVRPTFETDPVAPRVEAHILDFSSNLYGEELELTFISRLREERRFSSVENLVAQIKEDIAQARRILLV